MSLTLAVPAWKRLHTVETSPLLQAVIICELSGTTFFTFKLQPMVERLIEKIEVRNNFSSAQRALKRSKACSLSDIV
jgi:hypothetical protein